jgi:hypothetical protein
VFDSHYTDTYGFPVYKVLNSLSFDREETKAASTYIETDNYSHIQGSRSHCPRGLSLRSTAARLLRSWVQIPPRLWMFVFTFAYTIFRCVNQLNVKVLVISVRTQLYNLQVFLLA